MSNGGRPRPVQWLDTVNASPLEIAAGGLIGIGVLLVGLIWGAGMASSWLVNGEAAPIGLNDAGLALARFGSNGLAWEGTWEPAVEQQLPGPGWFWLIFGVEVLAVAAFFWPLWRLLGPRPAAPEPIGVVITEPATIHPRSARRRAARQAAEESSSSGSGSGSADTGGVDGNGSSGGGGGYLPGVADASIDKLLVDQPDGQRLVLGRVGEQLVATEKQQSVIVFGPAQSGKTSGLTAPALLDWRGPVLVATAKADLLPLTWDQRVERGGRTWLFDPTLSVAGERPPSSWSPLHLIESIPRPREESDVWRRQQQWTLARRTARWMVGATQPPTGGSGTDRSLVAAEQMLAPLLFAAACEELPISRVAEWISRREHDQVSVALERSGVGEAVATWEAAHSHDAATTAASFQTLAVVMYPYSDPQVHAQATRPEINAARLVDGNPNTLYIVAPPNHQARLRPVFATLLAEMIDEAMSHASAVGRLDPPLLVVVDDVGSCLPPTILDQLASVGASLGIQLLALFQDLGQVERAFGSREAVQLANNHQARMALPGLGDGPTLTYMNSLVRGSWIDPTGDDASAGWLRTLGDGDAMCVYGNLPPIYMQLRHWYDDPALSQRVEPPTEPERRFRLGWRRKEEEEEEDMWATGRYQPDPLDSDANDRAAARFWEQYVGEGRLPDKDWP